MGRKSESKELVSITLGLPHLNLHVRLPQNIQLPNMKLGLLFAARDKDKSNPFQFERTFLNT